MENILDRISKSKDDLPLKQRKLCEYILKNSTGVYLMTVGELSKKAEVGRATVMRVIELLECDSFSEFKKALNMACIESFADKDMDQPFVWSGSLERHDDPISSCFGESIQLLNKTCDDLDRVQFDRIVNLLLDAHQVNVIGLRTSSALSSHFCYHIEPLINAVKNLGDNESLAYDRILRFTSGDILVVIAAVPVTYSVVGITRLCHESGFPVIVITDSTKSPVLPYAAAHICLPTNTNKRWSVLPFIAAFEAIFSEIGLRTAPMSVRALNKRDKYLRDNKICIY